MAARFTLTREFTNAKAPADGTSQQYRLIDNTTGKQWLQAHVIPPTTDSGLTELATLFQTALFALAPTA